ncbi:MAG: hypothetical protein RL660_980 [Bacteroidota bacterium]|jgi:hypothetical protein
MRALTHILLTVVVVLCTTTLQVFAKGTNTQLRYMQRIVEALAHDSMQGREPGSVYEQKCAALIEKEFQQHKRLRCSKQNFQFVHPFTQQTISATNVLAYYDCKRDSTVLIGAHYDHLGLGAYKSASFGAKQKIHNGADDNASGVAIMLALVNNIVKQQQNKYNYLFVAYSAHELGLFGSAYLAKSKLPALSKCIAVYNFDMLGHLDSKENKLALCTANSDKYVAVTNDASNLKIEIESTDISNTDAGAFAAIGITCFSFSTGPHQHYHKYTDDAETINYTGMDTIRKFLLAHLKKNKFLLP